MLIAVVLGQWLLGPVIERRVRAHERWEIDVLRLGELITHDLARARWAAWRSFQRWKGLYDHADDEGIHVEDDDYLSGRLREVWEDAGSTSRAFSDIVGVRLRWLASRVETGIPKRTPTYRTFVLASMKYQTWVLGMAPHVIWEPGKREELETRWGKEDKARGELLSLVENLAQSIGPPPAVGYRMQRVWSRVRSPFQRHLRLFVGGVVGLMVLAAALIVWLWRR